VEPSGELERIRKQFVLLPFALSLSKGSRSWFDKLTTNGNFQIGNF
jgi:hypothetical protein